MGRTVSAPSVLDVWPLLCCSDRLCWCCVGQLAGALQEAQIPGQERGELCDSGGASAGAAPGLPDHHARREQGEPHELHRQRPGEEWLRHTASAHRIGTPHRHTASAGTQYSANQQRDMCTLWLRHTASALNGTPHRQDISIQLISRERYVHTMTQAHRIGTQWHTASAGHQYSANQQREICAHYVHKHTVCMHGESFNAFWISCRPQRHASHSRLQNAHKTDHSVTRHTHDYRMHTSTHFLQDHLNSQNLPASWIQPTCKTESFENVRQIMTPN